jgi:hypothetical protein
MRETSPRGLMGNHKCLLWALGGMSEIILVRTSRIMVIVVILPCGESKSVGCIGDGRGGMLLANIRMGERPL